MRRITIITLITILATVLMGATFIAPTPAGQQSMQYHMQIMIPLMTAMPHIGAAVIITLGLQAFTTRFKRAYSLLVAAYVVLGLGFIQTALLPLLNLMDSAWAKGVGIPLPFVISAVLGYLGIRNFARLFETKSIWNHVALAFLGSLALAVIATLLPHGPLNRPEAQFDAQVAVTVFNNTLFIWAGFLLWQVRKKAGQLYIPAMKWLLIGTFASASIMVPFLTLVFMQPNSQAANGVFILQIFTGFLLLKAAVEFYRITAPDQSEAPGRSGQLNAVDAVVYLAGFASSRNNVDSLLEPVREVTALEQTNEALTEVDQTKLAHAYLQLERYLLEKEPVRTFTKDELRELLHNKFGKVATTNPTFWKTVEAV